MNTFGPLKQGEPILPDVFKLAVSEAFNQIIITDPDGIIIYANPSILRLTGSPPEEVVGHTPATWGKQMPAEFYRNFWQRIRGKGKPSRGEVTNRRKDGSIYKAILTVTPICDANKLLIGYIGVEEQTG